jgi:predicted acyl esterase
MKISESVEADIAMCRQTLNLPTRRQPYWDRLTRPERRQLLEAAGLALSSWADHAWITITPAARHRILRALHCHSADYFTMERGYDRV